MRQLSVQKTYPASAKWGLSLLLAICLFLAGTAYLAQAAPPDWQIEDGQAIFEEKCASCHTIGGGNRVGPDLQGVTARRDPAWLARWIAEPDVMIAEGDPLALEELSEFNGIPMPNTGLTDGEVAAVIAFMEAESGEASAPPAVIAEPVAAEPVAAVPAGDPVAGENLFTGSTPLQNGGTACISCHSVTDVGALGGGNLGPDLTNVYTRYGEAGLPSALQGLPFPTMAGVFDNKPLTESETADLYAFFVEVDPSTTQPASLTFVLLGLAGFVVFGLLLHLLWGKRFTSVHKALVNNSGD